MAVKQKIVSPKFSILLKLQKTENRVSLLIMMYWLACPSRGGRQNQNILSEYKSGVDLWGGVVKVNAISKNEFLNSKYSQYLKAKEKTAYKDKLLSAQNLDEILKSGKNKKIEDLKHSRNDSFKQFAHSDVLLKVGENGYTADVIIGITTQNAWCSMISWICGRQM